MIFEPQLIMMILRDYWEWLWLGEGLCLLIIEDLTPQGSLWALARAVVRRWWVEVEWSRLSSK